MRSLIFLSVFVVFLSSQCIQSLENVNMADVAIAFNVADYAKIPDAYNDSIATFLDMFTQDGASFGEDKLRVSVVQYSSNVKVLIPLQKGTSADAIKKATVINDGNNSTSLPSEDVAGAVRKAVFGDPNDRPFVPKLVVIVAISNSAVLRGIVNWSSEVQPEVSRLWSQSTARAADVVQIAHIRQLLVGGQREYKIYVRRSSSNPILGILHESPADAFNDLGMDALARLQDALKTCPYDNDNIPCYYEFKKCLARVNVNSDKVQYDNRKYCLFAIPCPNGDQGCRTQCEKVSTPIKCCKIPKSMDSETVYYHQKCMAFDNYSSAMEPCENSPWSTGSNGNTSAKPSDQRGAKISESEDVMLFSIWWIVGACIITALVCLSFAYLVYRIIVKNIKDAENLKALVAKKLNDDMHKKEIEDMKKKHNDEMKQQRLDIAKEVYERGGMKVTVDPIVQVYDEPDSSRSSMSLSRQSQQGMKGKK